MTNRGFTLLEVIVALAILSVAILGFHQGQASSVRLTVRSDDRTQAYLLAQKQMTEIELQLRKSSFTALPEDEKGEFKDDNDKFKKFKWARKFEKVDLGCFIPGSQDTGGSSGDAADGSSAAQSQSNSNGAQGILSLAKQIFDKAIRKITVTVEWDEGRKHEKAILTQLYIRFDDVTGY